MTRCFKLLAALGLSVCGLGFATIAASENSPYLYCTTCHGADGNGNISIAAPKISGMEGWYIANQIHAFLAGWRGVHAGDDAGAEMKDIAKLLEQPEDLYAAIAYIGDMDSLPAPVTVDGDIENGHTLYQTCATCHGPEAQGLQALNAPGLSGQSDWYLVKALNDFRNGARGAHPQDLQGMQMRATVTLLQDEKAVNDVVAYIKSLDKVAN